MGRTHAFQSTPKFSKEELGRFIEGNGGRWNAFTSNDYTAYYETLPSDKISVALALESDRMQNSVFDPDEVEAERTVILSEREGYENTPQFVLREEVQATAYKAHPYQWGIIGWPSDLRTMTRDDLYNYYRQRYVPNNATLVLVGDFDTADLMKQVKTHFVPSLPVSQSWDPRRLNRNNAAKDESRFARKERSPMSLSSTTSRSGPSRLLSAGSD